MIDILLAAYNGEKYLQELLDSLKEQTYSDWKLIVIDDCSEDDTVNILNRFSREAGVQVELIRNRTRERSGKNNFIRLLRRSGSEYFMFCDQDDVWLPDKIEKTLKLMKKTECGNNGKRIIPALVHTDLQVVDEKLIPIRDSFFGYSGLRKDFSLKYLLCQNTITGCTLMGNAALRRVFCEKKPDPDMLNMHDEWLGLIAACFGRIAFLDEATILYRQHGNNTVGAADAGSLKYQLQRLKVFREMKKSNMDHVTEAAYFLELYGPHIHNRKNRKLLERFARAETASAMYYRKTCVFLGILKYPLKRAFMQILLAQK